MQAQKEHDWNLRRMSRKVRGKTEEILDRMLLISKRKNMELLTSLDSLEDAVNRLGKGLCTDIDWEYYLNSLSSIEQGLHTDRLFYQRKYSPRRDRRRRSVSDFVRPRAHGVEGIRTADQGDVPANENADSSNQALAATAFVAGMALGSRLASRRHNASSGRLSICSVD